MHGGQVFLLNKYLIKMIDVIHITIFSMYYCYDGVVKERMGLN
jgi:hypothetical protein